MKPPTSGRRYPSLPHWLAQRRQKRELRGEELRLLYVALTRARDNLILTASITQKNWDEVWTQPPAVTPQKIAGARSFADWLALWFGATGIAGFQPASSGGETATRRLEAGGPSEMPQLAWRIVADEELAGKAESGKRKAESEAPSLDETSLNNLRARLEWNYPRVAATQRKAKSSVTALRREAEALDDESEKIFPTAPKSGKQPVLRSSTAEGGKAESGKQKLSAAEIGSAHHKFLQHVALEKTSDLAAEAARLVVENYLSAAECAALDLAALAAFWNSPLGQKIVAHAASVRRELPFTARFSPAEIAAIIGGKTADGLKNEFIVVQGVADLVVLLPDEIWLVDFKTDAVGEGELAAKVAAYRPQLQLYAAALGKIFARAVTRRALYFLSQRTLEEI